MSTATPVARFGPTSGLFSGVLGLLCAATCIAVAVLPGGSLRSSLLLGFGGLAFAGIVWAYFLRPRIVLDTAAGVVVLRNPLYSWVIPLAAVRAVQVRAVTGVRTDEHTYDGIAVGYPLRKLVRSRYQPAGSSHDAYGVNGRLLSLEPDRPPQLTHASQQDEQTLMRERLLHAADEARMLNRPAGPVVRRWARIELTVIAVASAGFVVALVL